MIPASFFVGSSNMVIPCGRVLAGDELSADFALRLRSASGVP